MAYEAPWSDLKATIYAFLYRNPRSNRRIAGIVPLQADDHVLDIGCGPGSAVRAAASLVKTATGLDAAPKMIDIARERSGAFDNVTFSLGPAEALPFEDESFTIVWTISSWHHWNDSLAGLREAVRVLRPGGHFYVLEKRTRGDHGLDDARAARLAEQMSEAGLAGPAVTTIRKDIVVSANKPLEAA